MNTRIQLNQTPDNSAALVMLCSPQGMNSFLKSNKLPSILAKITDKTALKKLFQLRGFKGKDGQCLVHSIASAKNFTTILFYCLDANEEKNGNFYRNHGSSLLGKLDSAKLEKVQFNLDYAEGLSASQLEGLLEGLLLKDYSYSRFKSTKQKKQRPRVVFLPKSKITVKLPLKQLSTLAKSTCLARDLVNTPPNKCFPADMVRITKAQLKNSGIRVTAYNKAQLQKMSANLLLAVSEGSSQAPYLLKLVYKPKGGSKKPPLAIVGKGVTFDSGGLSIKSGSGMMAMKCDMAGAAAVIGAMDAIAALKPKREVRAYIPLVENMINGSATRPGDIVKGMHGKTVEILNTDAEGRLILSDALTLADKEGAQKIISLATLTGACMVALGNLYAGLFSNNESLCQELKQAAAKTGELLWELPLADEYRDQLKSHPADLKNIGGSYGGAITAALFLEHSIKKAQWAHIDLAGPAFLDGASGYHPKGGTGFGVRTLVRWIQSLS
ncbi:MAG: leucyl aminopeptidase [Bdellovibrionales bacterium]|nr:leucyl aminopeptidase [Bdellovibrionales bacterium]